MQTNQCITRCWSVTLQLQKTSISLNSVTKLRNRQGAEMTVIVAKVFRSGAYIDNKVT